MELKSFRLFFSKPIHLMESDFVSSSKSYFLSFLFTLFNSTFNVDIEIYNSSHNSYKSRE